MEAGIVFVRKSDELGRIVLSREVRKDRDINKGDLLEILTDEDRIILRKCKPLSCLFCGEEEGVKLFMGKRVCTNCVSEMVKQFIAE